MAAVEVNGIEGLKTLRGQTIGPGEWRQVTQEDLDSFAELSGDDQWIHVDVERAEKESPFGTTVAHGNLTLSLIDGLRLDLMRSTGFRLGVNCGWNRVRFPAPVPAGSRVQVESRHASQRPQAVGRARQLRRTVAVPADRTTKRRTTVTAMASSAYPSTGMTSGIRSNGIAE